jgi:hypothetical protein
LVWSRGSTATAPRRFFQIVIALVLVLLSDKLSKKWGEGRILRKGDAIRHGTKKELRALSRTAMLYLVLTADRFGLRDPFIHVIALRSPRRKRCQCRVYPLADSANLDTYKYIFLHLYGVQGLYNTIFITVVGQWSYDHDHLMPIRSHTTICR